MTIRQLSIAFGKYIAGYRPGDELWSDFDQEAFDFATEIKRIKDKGDSFKISLPAAQLLEKGVWDQYCEEVGLNPWCINEGLMNSNETVELTKEQAIKYGFLRRDK